MQTQPCLLIPACFSFRGDITLVTDTSNVDTYRWSQLRQFLARIVQGWSIGPNSIQVGSITYATGAMNDFYFNTYK